MLIKLSIYTIAALGAGMLALPAAGIEQPKFEVITSFGDVEIRRYEPTVVARTNVDGALDAAGNQGFRRIAGYIFGGNATEQKIAMTAPVEMAPQAGESARYWVQFTMPEEHALESLPTPDDAAVQLIEMPAQTLAVLKYRGNWSEKRYLEHKEKLLTLIEQIDGWQGRGEVRWARYNSPIMPSFMRTNEVAIEVVPSTGVVQ